MIKFFFGDQQTLALVGWHMALVLAFITGLYVNHVWHKTTNK